MNKILISLKKIFKDVKRRYRFLIITGSFILNLYEDKENQKIFLKNLQAKGDNDIDILVISSKFLLPRILKTDEKIMPPEKVIDNFSRGRIEIVATKVRTPQFLLSLQFIHPKYFKFICSLERINILYFRNFSLNRNTSIHCGFKRNRKYIFAKDKQHSKGLLIFRHQPVINNHFYLNDFQQMILLGRELYNLQEFEKIKENLFKKIYFRFLKENVGDLTHFFNIFYNQNKWSKNFRQIIFNEIGKIRE